MPISHETEKSAGCVLVHQSADGLQALLIRVRARGFEIPKGHVEVGESPEQAALREIREETALASRVHIERNLGEIEYVLQRGEHAIWKHVAYFLARALEAPEFGKRPSGTRELIWIGEEEARSIELVNEELRPLILSALEDG